MVPGCVIPGQQYLLLWEILAKVNEVLDQFELPEVEVGQVGELVVHDKFVEGVWI